MYKTYLISTFLSESVGSLRPLVQYEVLHRTLILTVLCILIILLKIIKKYVSAKLDA